MDFSLLVLLFTLLYICYHVIEKQKCVGLPPLADGCLPFIGHVASLGPKAVEFIHKTREKYGDVVTIKIFNRVIILIVDQGPLYEFFKAREEVLSFTKFKVKAGVLRMVHGTNDNRLVPPITAAIRKLTAIKYDSLLEKEVNISIAQMPDKGEMDVFLWARRLISRITFQVVLGEPISSELQDDFMQFEVELSAAIGARIFIPEWLSNILHAPNIDRKRTALCHKLIPFIAKAKKQQVRTAFLDAILESVDEKTNKPYSDMDIAIAIMSVTFAAVANSANGVAQTLVFAAKNPHLVKELVADVCKTNPGSSVWTHAWVMETARLTPSNMLCTRVTVEDVTIGGYCIPTDTLVVVASASIQTAKEFKNPNHFEPQRFLPQNVFDSHLKYPVTNWGAGIHLCPGKLLAISEMKWTLGIIVQKFEFEVVKCNDKLNYNGGVAICQFTEKCILSYKKIIK